MPNHTPKPQTPIVAVIVAAGRGTRAGGDGPKQYERLGGAAVLARSLMPFQTSNHVREIIVVIHADDTTRYEQALVTTAKLLAPVIGGSTRQASVLTGLRAAEAANATHVLIHDAARPFLPPETLQSLIAALDKNDAVIPALPVSDTLRQATDTGLETVSRDNLFAAQTPQCFRLAPLLAAHEKAAEEKRHDFTDDAAIAEWAGLPVTLVRGHPDNMKLTSEADMDRARQQFLVPDVRVGHGYDTHRLVAGNHVMLCGVEIANPMTLDGHSDADVGLHALTDALLATIGAGDIGDHFPPSDPQWKGVASGQFLEHAVGLVRAKGGTITHCDVTLLCEQPQIGPHKSAMRARIASICNIDADRVSVKATTNETIGFVGRKEGIVALATATAVFRT